MAPKRATFYTYGNDTICDDTMKFVADAGVLLTVRNLVNEPFSVRELKGLIGHIDVKHFLNSASPEYATLKLDEHLNDLEELFKIISENNDVLRRPIVRTPRLVTVGCDKNKIAEMLQISNGSGQKVDDLKGNLKNSKYVTRRTPTKSSDSKPSTTTVTTPTKVVTPAKVVVPTTRATK